MHHVPPELALTAQQTQQQALLAAFTQQYAALADVLLSHHITSEVAAALHQPVAQGSFSRPDRTSLVFPLNSLGQALDATARPIPAPALRARLLLHFPASAGPVATRGLGWWWLLIGAALGVGARAFHWL